ncbi:MAG: DUF3892 domain-containing protein [Oscillospiraceae bacterium]|jgi:hypothetical protein|nr:DUF3892 domain-containing protein [Oscillospiraceae bacterium]
MKATKIKMKPGCGTSNNLVEIDEIYLTGATKDGFYKKADVHDYLTKNPRTIQVNISPFPNCIPATSANGEKYVKSAPDSTTKDNLLNLPRV